MRHLPIHIPSYQSLFEDFDIYIMTKGYNRGKPCSLPSCVREFLFFLESRNIYDLKEVMATEIIAYHQYLMERPNQRRGGGLSDSHIKSHLFSLRLFFDYLLDIGELETSPARLPKFILNKHKERNILTTEEIDLLYKVCETKQDRAMISLAYGCGLRRSELEKLDASDIHLQQGIVVVRDSKNHKSRVVPLSNGVMKDLKEYILYERMKYMKSEKVICHALFINFRGERKAGQYMNDRLRQLIQRTQSPIIISKEITLHSLRHSIATHLLDNGATIEFVKDFLGHSQIDTAHLYSKRRKQRLKILSQL